MKQIKFFLYTLCLTLLLAACGSATEPIASESNSNELEISNVEANLSLPTDTGAIYMTITNNTESDEILIGASVPGCETVELHEMMMEDGVMKMREVDGGQIPIAAGETATLKRGGLHVMCMGKAAPTAAGEIVPVTLEFANAGSIEVEAKAIEIDEMGHDAMESDEMGNGDMEHDDGG